MSAISTEQLIINLIALSSRIESPSLLAAAERLRELTDDVASLRTELEGAHHNRFFDQRDAYFAGVDDGRR